MPLSAGTYYVALNAKSPSATGPYQIDLSCAKISIQGTLGCGQTVSGSITNPLDTHYYQMTFSTAKGITINDCNTEFNPTLLILNQDYQDISSGIHCWDGTSTANDCNHDSPCPADTDAEFFKIDNLYHGRYYVQISSNNQVGIGNYFIDVNCHKSNLCCQCTTDGSGSGITGCSSDMQCQDIICQDNPLCCSNGWDNLCADAASAVCIAAESTNRPTIGIVSSPTMEPSVATINPTLEPTLNPTARPSKAPIPAPTDSPSETPISAPTTDPSTAPTASNLCCKCKIDYEGVSNPGCAADLTCQDDYVCAKDSHCCTADWDSACIAIASAICDTLSPTNVPTDIPTAVPSSDPKLASTLNPTVIPSDSPTEKVSVSTGYPTNDPTIYLTTDEPTVDLKGIPTINPTAIPTDAPTGKLKVTTSNPTKYLSSDPTPDPTPIPTIDLKSISTSNPTAIPTDTPTGKVIVSSSSPTNDVTTSPTSQPTVDTSGKLTNDPTFIPSTYPTESPSNLSIPATTTQPSEAPTITGLCCKCKVRLGYWGSPNPGCAADLICQNDYVCAKDPYCCTNDWDYACISLARGFCDTPSPTMEPTTTPTTVPSANPTALTTAPTDGPTGTPTMVSSNPTRYPSSDPTNDPTIHPTIDPTFDPTNGPTDDPTEHPTEDPTFNPTAYPTAKSVKIAVDIPSPDNTGDGETEWSNKPDSDDKRPIVEGGTTGAAHTRGGTFSQSVFGEHSDLIIFILLAVILCCIAGCCALFFRARDRKQKKEEMKKAEQEQGIRMVSMSPSEISAPLPYKDANKNVEGDEEIVTGLPSPGSPPYQQMMTPSSDLYSKPSLDVFEDPMRSSSIISITHGNSMVYSADSMPVSQMNYSNSDQAIMGNGLTPGCSPQQQHISSQHVQQLVNMNMMADANSQDFGATPGNDQDELANDVHYEEDDEANDALEKIWEAEDDEDVDSVYDALYDPKRRQSKTPGEELVNEKKSQVEKEDGYHD